MDELKLIIQDIRSRALPRSAFLKFVMYQISKNIAWICFGMALGTAIGLALR